MSADPSARLLLQLHLLPTPTTVGTHPRVLWQSQKASWSCLQQIFWQALQASFSLRWSGDSTRLSIARAANTKRDHGTTGSLSVRKFFILRMGGMIRALNNYPAQFASYLMKFVVALPWGFRTPLTKSPQRAGLLQRLLWRWLWRKNTHEQTSEYSQFKHFHLLSHTTQHSLRRRH